MIRAPVKLLPSAPGASIHVPAEFVTTIVDAASGVPYDPLSGQWVRSLRAGAWLVGFEVPKEIGDLKPARAVISAELAAPGHVIVIRRGQSPGGATPADTADGPVVAEWKQVVGARDVSVQLDPDDVDRHGRLWLRVAVEPVFSAAGAGIQPEWNLNRLDVSLDVTVLGNRQP
jgi:hypothetical protein